ncbi:unnamed protein product [Brachionus calyciflorus]|uniref:Uncharacterized protein n=1 Tax=Brachionus calyciflorus TaxID=104777 RepID=A0A813X5H7_9BILA|nr:unnamed protein product [Brachionus calyciflorus]
MTHRIDDPNVQNMVKSDLTKLIGLTATQSTLLFLCNQQTTDPKRFDKGLFYFSLALGMLNGIGVGYKLKNYKAMYGYISIGMSSGAVTYSIGQSQFQKQN